MLKKCCATILFNSGDPCSIGKCTAYTRFSEVASSHCIVANAYFPA